MERRDFLKNSLGCVALTLGGANILQAENTRAHQNKSNQLHKNPYPTVTSCFTSNGKNVKVHAISTGSISVKKNFMIKNGPGFISKMNIKFGKEYTPFLPIWVYVIEHPEGIIVIDTGDVEAAGHDEFYKNESAGNKMILKAMSNIRRITREDELDRQLAALHIRIADVSKVIMTHLHGDHIDGIKFFPETEIIVYELEKKYPVGYLPATIPSWFNPTLVNYRKDSIDYFDNAYSITKAEDIFLVPTPGHTTYHSSVLFKTDHEHILFAGDLTYQNYQLDKGELSGSHADYHLASRSIQKTLDYAKKYPLIYLTSHGYDVPELLLNKILKESK